MKESAASFGRNGNLIGIESEPEAPRDGRPHVLILNSGLLHKVGPFRLSVDLARRLAASGYRVLRFDLSGLGDSKLRVATGEDEDRPVADAREAMDFLSQRHGSRRFVLMGLCSGSDNSHRTAVADERVVGGVHLDGYGFRTPAYLAHHYARRLLSPTFYRRRFSRTGEDHTPAPGGPINANARKFPPIEQVTREFEALMCRDVRLLYVYTRGVDRYVNYKSQLRDSFPSVDFGDRLELELYPLAEHTYPLVRGRARVVSRVVDWMNREFGR
jgi:pimeloyl-ACP methyl ester carboxylesterase